MERKRNAGILVTRSGLKKKKKGSSNVKTEVNESHKKVKNMTMRGLMMTQMKVFLSTESETERFDVRMGGFCLYRDKSPSSKKTTQRHGGAK